MGTGANGHRSINRDLGQIGTWKNEYLGKWVLEEKIFWGELGTGANELQGKWTFGERGTLSALIFLCPFPLKCLKWAVGQMGTRGKWTFGGKRYPKCPKGVFQVPWAHYPKMFTNGHLGQKDIWGKRYPK